MTVERQVAARIGFAIRYKHQCPCTTQTEPRQSWSGFGYGIEITGTGPLGDVNRIPVRHGLGCQRCGEGAGMEKCGVILSSAEGACARFTELNRSLDREAPENSGQLFRGAEARSYQLQRFIPVVERLLVSAVVIAQNGQDRRLQPVVISCIGHDWGPQS